MAQRKTQRALKGKRNTRKPANRKDTHKQQFARGSHPDLMASEKRERVFVFANVNQNHPAYGMTPQEAAESGHYKR